ncbi:MAG: O-antigen ligase family protein [Candidatus Saccharibacteria bacterium]|nr:O-antigen ligase family protein [Candidatus Saccharibacteria bacterium]
MSKLRVWWQELRSAQLSITEWWLLLAPVLLWFSYYPTVQFTRTSAMNIEVSLAVVYVAVLAIIGLPHSIRHWRQLARRPIVWLSGAAVVWMCLSVLWSANPLRAILTAGMWGVLLLSLLTVLSIPHKKFVFSKMVDVYVVTSIAMALVAVAQVVYGVWVDWGLCAGCVAGNFGFVRSNGFAIEPQFFGSMLIAPIIIIAQRLIAQRRPYDGLWLSLLSMALYLTLSRGAIFALGGALVVFVLIHLRTVSGRRGVAKVMLIGVAGVVAGMLWHGLWTQLNPKVADTFYDAIAKSVNQISLGVVSLSKHEAPAMPAAAPTVAPPPAKYDGLVEESTTHRTTLSARALSTWQRDVPTMLFGVGIGGAGQAMYEQYRQQGWAMEIVQNEHIERLLEGGIIGAMLCLGVMIYVLWATRSTRWVWAIIIGYIVQWNFFSGLPNALHIYLVVMVIFATIVGSDDEKTTFSRRLCVRSSA